MDPPGQADITSIRVNVDISHHGGQRGEIVCDVADTGSLEIPAALVTGLLDLGYSGFPTVQIERRSVGSTQIEPGIVEFVVLSRNELSLSIPGLTSCSVDTDCATGETCQADLQCG